MFGFISSGVMSDYWMFNLEWFDETYALEGVSLFRSVLLSLIIILIIYMQYFKQSMKKPTCSKYTLFCSLVDDFSDNGTPFILFYNPESGGFHRNTIVQQLMKQYSNMVCVNVLKGDLVSTIQSITPTEKTKVIICGGDISYLFLKIFS